MTKTAFLRLLEKELAASPGAIQGSEDLADLAFWDSMSTLTFMALADRELQVRVTAKQLEKCHTIKDLLDLLAGKLSD
jgi:acyl carrier protein